MFITLLLIFKAGIMAQKPALDTAALASWPTIGDVSISPDGQYISYKIRTPNTPAVLYLQSTEGNFAQDLGYGMDGIFTTDGKRFIYRLPGDSLCVFKLSCRSSHYRNHVQSYKIPEEGNGQWLAYLSRGEELVVEDLFTSEEKRFAQVEEFRFSPGGKALLLQGKGWLKWIDLDLGQVVMLYQGGRVSHLSFDTAEKQVAFIVSEEDGGHPNSTIRLYRSGMDSAALVVDEHTSGVEPGFLVKENELEFSQDGEKLFFTLHHESPGPDRSLLGANLEVWSYKDEYPRFERWLDPSIDHLIDFKGVLAIKNGKVRRLQEETDGGDGIELLNKGGDADYLLTATKYDVDECYWRPKERPSLYLVNTNEGTRKRIASKALYGLVAFSPSGKYVIWFDMEKQAYFTHNILTGLCKNISKKIFSPLTNELNDLAGPGFLYGILAWLGQDSSVLIYDRYDIWKVDPDGKKSPVNLTNGFGRKHKIVLRGVYTTGKDRQKEVVIGATRELTLCALDERSKDNGFYTINVGRPGNPLELLMGPGVYYFSSISWASFPQDIYKTKHADEYLLTKSSGTDYPNLVLTSDFKHFESMTDLQPQRRYNWLTSELMRWKTFAGRESEGILYKPEDFDPKKKYPILFYYYERKSDGLNLFNPAELADGPMNIPWFVSHGYLVFCSDIRYTPGDVGNGVYDHVVSAARMMRAKPWVDGSRMGIQGHSFGGFETNYLVTRTKLFAAAVSSAGVTDLIDVGEINTVHPNGLESFVEYGQLRMKYPYWQRPDLYIRNSPVFHVDKVSTPMLLVANKNDGAVQWQQGEELFMALRRLGKPVWMLQYNPDNHFLQGNNALDYTIRMTQFFDHYLKGGPAPKWMRD